MDTSTLQMLLGPYGLTVGAVFVVIAVTRAALHLHKVNQELHQKRIEDQDRYLALVESQQQHHLEAQRIVTKGALIMERVETILNRMERSG